MQPLQSHFFFLQNYSLIFRDICQEKRMSMCVGKKLLCVDGVQKNVWFGKGERIEYTYMQSYIYKGIRWKLIDLIQSRFVCPLLFPFYFVIELNRGKKNRISYCKTLNGFPNILLAANKIFSSNFIKRAISCSPVSFLEQKCEANFMIVLFAVHFLKGSDPIGFLPFSPPWQSGVGFLY